VFSLELTPQQAFGYLRSSETWQNRPSELSLVAHFNACLPLLTIHVVPLLRERSSYAYACVMKTQPDRLFINEVFWQCTKNAPLEHLRQAALSLAVVILHELGTR